MGVRGTKMFRGYICIDYILYRLGDDERGSEWNVVSGDHRSGCFGWATCDLLIVVFFLICNMWHEGARLT